MFKSKGLPYLPEKYKRGGKLWDKALEDLQDKMFTFLIHEEDTKFFGVLCWILGWQCRGRSEMKKEKCRCYINSKYYAQQAKMGGAGMKNYKPCPIHEDCTKPKPIKEPEYKVTNEEDK